MVYDVHYTCQDYVSKLSANLTDVQQVSCNFIYGKSTSLKMSCMVKGMMEQADEPIYICLLATEKPNKLGMSLLYRCKFENKTGKTQGYALTQPGAYIDGIL